MHSVYRGASFEKTKLASIKNTEDPLGATKEFTEMPSIHNSIEAQVSVT